MIKRKPSDTKKVGQASPCGSIPVLETADLIYNPENEQTILFFDGFFNIDREASNRLKGIVQRILPQVNLIEIKAPHEITKDHLYVKLRKLQRKILRKKPEDYYGRMWFDISKVIPIPAQVAMYALRVETVLTPILKKGFKNVQPELEMLSKAIQQVTDRLEAERGIKASDIILLGHSQGGMVSEYHAYRRKDPVRLAINICGIPILTDENGWRQSHPPFLFVGGTADTIIPHSMQKIRLKQEDEWKTPNYLKPLIREKDNHYLNEEKLVDTIERIRTIESNRNRTESVRLRINLETHEPEWNTVRVRKRKNSVRMAERN